MPWRLLVETTFGHLLGCIRSEYYTVTCLLRHTIAYYVLTASMKHIMYTMMTMMIIYVETAPLKSACTLFKWPSLFLGFVSFSLYLYSFILKHSLDITEGVNAFVFTSAGAIFRSHLITLSFTALALPLPSSSVQSDSILPPIALHNLAFCTLTFHMLPFGSPALAITLATHNYTLKVDSSADPTST